MKTKRKLLVLVLCTLGVVSTSAIFAQNTGLRRAIIERADLSIPHREAIVVRIELDAGMMAGKHTHPGEEISYILEGEGELLIEGAPPRKLKAGDAFIVPAGKVHDAKSTGSVPLKLVGTYIVTKGEALASPAK